MIRAYLLLNAAMYALFAIWCAVDPVRTASAVGFTFRSGSGRSEFIAVYGGLEMGVAVFFLIAALRPAYQEAGLLFALLFYGGIVLFRSYAFLTTSGIERTTFILASLEVLLGLAAAALWWRRAA